MQLSTGCTSPQSRMRIPVLPRAAVGWIWLVLRVYVCACICVFIYGTQGIYDAQHAYCEHVECKLNQGWCGGPGRGRVRVVCMSAYELELLNGLYWNTFVESCIYKCASLGSNKKGRRGDWGGRSASPKAEWQYLSVLLCAGGIWYSGILCIFIFIYL